MTKASDFDQDFCELFRKILFYIEYPERKLWMLNPIGLSAGFIQLDLMMTRLVPDTSSTSMIQHN